MAKKDRRRAPSDDEGVERDVEGGAAIMPASLKGLDDDTVLIVTSFLPECRDVLSLSVTRDLPETAWRAAHKSLLPGLHLARRVDQASSFGWAVAIEAGATAGRPPSSSRPRRADTTTRTSGASNSSSDVRRRSPGTSSATGAASTRSTRSSSTSSASIRRLRRVKHLRRWRRGRPETLASRTPPTHGHTNKTTQI